MKGLIIKRDDKIRNDIKSILDFMDGEQLKYNWLIICEDIPFLKPQNIELFTQNEYCFLSGEELTRIENDDVQQWIWGVLSAIPKDVPLLEQKASELPMSL